MSIKLQNFSVIALLDFFVNSIQDSKKKHEASLLRNAMKTVLDNLNDSYVRKPGITLGVNDMRTFARFPPDLRKVILFNDNEGIISKGWSIYMKSANFNSYPQSNIGFDVEDYENSSTYTESDDDMMLDILPDPIDLYFMDKFKCKEMIEPGFLSNQTIVKLPMF